MRELGFDSSQRLIRSHGIGDSDSVFPRFCTEDLREVHAPFLKAADSDGNWNRRTSCDDQRNHPMEQTSTESSNETSLPFVHSFLHSLGGDAETVDILKAVLLDLLPRANLQRHDQDVRLGLEEVLENKFAGIINGSAWDRGELQIYKMCGQIFLGAVLDLLNWMTSSPIQILTMGILAACVAGIISCVIDFVLNRPAAGYKPWTGIVQGRRCTGRRWTRTNSIKLSHRLMFCLIVSAECINDKGITDSMLPRNDIGFEGAFSGTTNMQDRQDPLKFENAEIGSKLHASRADGQQEHSTMKGDNDYSMLMQRLQYQWPRWFGPDALCGMDGRDVRVRIWPITGRRNAYMRPHLQKHTVQLKRNGQYQEQIQNVPEITRALDNGFRIVIVNCPRDLFDHHQHRAEILAVDDGHEFNWQFEPVLADVFGTDFRFRAAAMVPKPEETISVQLLFDIFHEWH